MARMSKQQEKIHDLVMNLIHCDAKLTFEDKEFILQIYKGDGIGGRDAFFTPEGLAWNSQLILVHREDA